MSKAYDPLDKHFVDHVSIVLKIKKKPSGGPIRRRLNRFKKVENCIVHAFWQKISKIEMFKRDLFTKSGENL